MTPYATVEDLADYLGIEPPADSDRLLKRASELIRNVAIGVIDPTEEVTAEALRDATCAQVEQWLMVGEDQAISGRMKNSQISVGSLRVDSAAATVAPRALNFLANANLHMPIGW